MLLNTAAFAIGLYRGKEISKFLRNEYVSKPAPATIAFPISKSITVDISGGDPGNILKIK